MHFQTWAVIKVETCMDGYEEGDGSEREYGAQINLLLSETADHVIFRKERKKRQGRKQQERKERARELTKAKGCFNLTALCVERKKSRTSI